jgi:hypothetical protein
VSALMSFCCSQRMQWNSKGSIACTTAAVCGLGSTLEVRTTAALRPAA